MWWKGHSRVGPAVRGPWDVIHYFLDWSPLKQAISDTCELLQERISASLKTQWIAHGGEVSTSVALPSLFSCLQGNWAEGHEHPPPINYVKTVSMHYYRFTSSWHRLWWAVISLHIPKDKIAHQTSHSHLGISIEFGEEVWWAQTKAVQVQTLESQ